MVHQTYVQRLLLGRSSRELPTPAPQSAAQVSSNGDGYVQLFNARGYPEHLESRVSARRLRRAQNDILTAIGVCVSDHDQAGQRSPPSTTPNSSKLEQEQARINIEEHSRSFWFEVCAGMCFSVLPEWSNNIRRRVQTFDYYLDVPIWAIVRSEFNHLGLWTFFLAGKLPLLAVRLSGSIAEFLFDVLSERFPKAIQFPVAPAVIETIARGAMLVLSTPIYVATNLQQLGLVSDWRNPLTMHLNLLRIFGANPLTQTFPDFLRCLARSPLLLAALYVPIYDLIDRKLYAYCKAIFARPDNPSTMSYKLEGQGYDFDTSDAPVLSLPEFQLTLREELKKDYSMLSSAAKSIMTYLGRFLERKQHPSSAVADLKRHDSGVGTHAVTFAEPLPDEVLSAPTNIALPNGMNPPTTPTSAMPITTSPPQSPGSSHSDPLSEINPSAVQVRTRSGSTSTLHMDLEVHLPVAAQEQRAERRAQNTDSPTAGVVDGTKSFKARSRARHRVTALSILPSEEMANFCSGIATSLIMLPLESLILRRTARIFLESDFASSSWLRRTVYGRDSLGSMKNTGWAGFAAYSARIALCYGMETILCMGAWRVGTWTVLRMGKTKYGWGSL